MTSPSASETKWKRKERDMFEGTIIQLNLGTDCDHLKAYVLIRYFLENVFLFPMELNMKR